MVRQWWTPGVWWAGLKGAYWVFHVVHQVVRQWWHPGVWWVMVGGVKRSYWVFHVVCQVVRQLWTPGVWWVGWKGPSEWVFHVVHQVVRQWSIPGVWWAGWPLLSATLTSTSCKSTLGSAYFFPYTIFDQDFNNISSDLDSEGTYKSYLDIEIKQKIFKNYKNLLKL